jgi:hypothetical protein
VHRLQRISSNIDDAGASKFGWFGNVITPILVIPGQSPKRLVSETSTSDSTSEFGSALNDFAVLRP